VKVLKQKQRGSLLLSVAIHVVLIALLGSITFRYELGDLLGIKRERPAAPERLHYLVLPSRPAAAIGNGSNPKSAPPKSAPAPLRAPTETPTTITPPAPTSPTEGAVSGKEGGNGGAPTGVATGVEPMAPDPRLPLTPGGLIVPRKTMAEKVDSSMKAAFGAYMDSMAIAAANAGRDPKDWTVEHNGQKWGLDQQYIHLGKWKLPSAILALLPLQSGGVSSQRVSDQRTASFIRQDIMEHAQNSVNEDEFRVAVKRIRERKERERREREKSGTIAAQDGKATPPPASGTTP
jgi:hypothetical protein